MAKIEVKNEIVKTETEEKLLNLSQLEFRFGINRATIRKRLSESGIEPHTEREKEKLFLLTDEIEEILTKSSDGLNAVKLRKETADAELKEIKVAEARGETASVAEFIGVTQQIFGSLHKKLAVQLPKRIAARLAKAKNQAEISQILTQEITKEFTDLRSNHKKFL